MEYTAEKVRELASQARLCLREEELLRLAQELNAMRALADRLEPAEALDGEERTVPLSELREDVLREAQDLSPAAFAPAWSGEYFVVPRTVEE